MVRVVGFEPTRIAAQEPKGDVNSVKGQKTVIYGCKIILILLHQVKRALGFLPSMI